MRHWGADFPDPQTFMEVFYSKSGNNYSGWKNTEYDALLEKSRNATSVEERLQNFKDAEKILLQDEIVVFPIFYRQNSAVVSKRVTDFKISPLNYLFFKTLQVQ